MASFLIADDATANATNANSTYELRLTDGPFGLQELESVTHFHVSNGRS